MSIKITEKDAAIIESCLVSSLRFCPKPCYSKLDEIKIGMSIFKFEDIFVLTVDYGEKTWKFDIHERLANYLARNRNVLIREYRGLKRQFRHYCLCADSENYIFCEEDQIAGELVPFLTIPRRDTDFFQLVGYCAHSSPSVFK